jgi:hypothetical protein
MLVTTRKVPITGGGEPSGMFVELSDGTWLPANATDDGTLVTKNEVIHQLTVVNVDISSAGTKTVTVPAGAYCANFKRVPVTDAYVYFNNDTENQIPLDAADTYTPFSSLTAVNIVVNTTNTNPIVIVFVS